MFNKDAESKAIEDEEESCAICLDDLHSGISVRRLLKCKHEFHERFLIGAIEVHASCPLCKIPLAIQLSNQPKGGEMNYSIIYSSLPSYEAYKTIEIQYYIPGSIQNSSHPNPGHSFPSTTRIAFLPNTPKGQKVLNFLKVAFVRGLTFTVGTSLTTELDNVIIWNDIHHKTTRFR